MRTALLQRGDAVSEFEDVGVMDHHQRRRAALAVQALQHLHHGATAVAAERRCRLLLPEHGTLPS